MSLRTRAGLLAASGVLALGLAGGAAASTGPAASFGQHVAACAQEHLGQPPAVPEVACTHDGTSMTFETFGGMVQHMQEHHG
jgi:hypothetical protein